MKIQLDTTQKVIRIEEKVNLKELFDILERLLPNELWKGFDLETTTIINWGSPIIIKPNEIYTQPYTTPTPYPYNFPWITCEAKTLDVDGYDFEGCKLTSGTFNLEL